MSSIMSSSLSSLFWRHIREKGGGGGGAHRMTYGSIQLRYTWKAWNKEMSNFLIYQMKKGLSHTIIVNQYLQLNKCVNWKRIRTPHFLCNLRLAFSLFPFVKGLLRMDPAMPQASEITILVAWRAENTSR